MKLYRVQPGQGHLRPRVESSQGWSIHSDADSSPTRTKPAGLERIGEPQRLA